MIHVAGFLSQEIASIYIKLPMYEILSSLSILEKNFILPFKSIFESLILSNVTSI